MHLYAKILFAVWAESCEFHCLCTVINSNQYLCMRYRGHEAVELLTLEPWSCMLTASLVFHDIKWFRSVKIARDSYQNSRPPVPVDFNISALQLFDVIFPEFILFHITWSLQRRPISHFPISLTRLTQYGLDALWRSGDRSVGSQLICGHSSGKVFLWAWEGWVKLYWAASMSPRGQLL